MQICLHIKQRTRLIPQKTIFKRGVKELSKMSCNYTVRLANTFCAMEKTHCVYLAI